VSHPCAYPTCQTVLADAVLCCRDHWWTLPQQIRSRIVLAWRARRDNPGNEELRGRHLEAVQEAYAFWLGLGPETTSTTGLLD
jgi:hypothetical protein